MKKLTKLARLAMTLTLALAVSGKLSFWWLYLSHLLKKRTEAPFKLTITLQIWGVTL